MVETWAEGTSCEERLRAPGCPGWRKGDWEVTSLLSATPEEGKQREVSTSHTYFDWKKTTEVHPHHPCSYTVVQTTWVAAIFIQGYFKNQWNKGWLIFACQAVVLHLLCEQLMHRKTVPPKSHLTDQKFPREGKNIRQLQAGAQR